LVGGTLVGSAVVPPPHALRTSAETKSVSSKSCGVFIGFSFGNRMTFVSFKDEVSEETLTPVINLGEEFIARKCSPC
jgi:hypothetical protein